MTEDLSQENKDNLPGKISLSIDWQRFSQSVKQVPLWRRFCLYPYAYLVSSLAKSYAKQINKLDASGLYYNPKSFFPLSREHYAKQYQFYLSEFEACCGSKPSSSFESLLIDQARDVGKYCRSLAKPPVVKNLLSIPFAILYLLGLMFLRFFSELFFAGKTKALLTNLYSDHAKYFDDPREIQDMAIQVRPVVLLGLYAAPATAVLLIGKQLIDDTLSLFKSYAEKPPADYLHFKQNTDRRKEAGPAAFYFSPVFGWTLFFFFAAGIPAAVSFWLYNHLGIDPLLGFPSHDKDFFTTFAIIDLYIYGLGWCLMTLFMTGYFTYLTNFGSTEYDIEIHPDLIKQLPIKGWAADIIFFSLHHPLKRMFWKDVTTVKLTSVKAGINPEKEKKSDSSFWKVFFKVDSVYHSLLNKMDMRSEYMDECLEIASASGSITIRLWYLSSKERAQLFYCLRKYAPSTYLAPTVQEALIGSTVLRDPRYTEIWFDVLTRTNQIDNREMLEPGCKLRQGRFTVSKKLISGGQANIYLGTDIDGKTVILKEFQLTPGESLDSLIESAAAFESESTILSQLNHPGIVKLHDLFIEGNRVYLALEHVEGLTLRELVKSQGKLDESTVLDLARQMCDILSYLHRRTAPIVHRDFTPDNLIRQPNGELKLIDFSVAQGQKGERNNCAGKHAYTPPEQFRGEACPASDIYALGATLYFLITGEDPEPISKSSTKDKRPDLSSQLNSIIETCTELNLENRYESVVWLKSEIESMQSQAGQTVKTITRLKDAVTGNKLVDSIEIKESTPETISSKISLSVPKLEEI